LKKPLPVGKLSSPLLKKSMPGGIPSNQGRRSYPPVKKPLPCPSGKLSYKERPLKKPLPVSKLSSLKKPLP
jgi:hypothetical protein